MGVESKSLTAVVFSGLFSYTLENRNAIGAASQVLETRLRKLLREKLSGTYNVSVQPSVTKIPREEFRVSIELGADPSRIDELGRAKNRRVEFKVLNTDALRLEREKRRFLRKDEGVAPAPAPADSTRK